MDDHVRNRLAALPERHGEATVLADVVEPRATDHRQPATDIRPPPGAPGCLATKLGRREGDRGKPAAALVGDDELAGAEVGHPLQREHWIAQVDQDRTAEDQVELATEEFGRGVIDRQANPLNRASEGGAGELEALAAPLVSGRTQTRRPVEGLNAVHVQRGHRRAAALELEGPEALERADVQDPQAGEVVRDAVFPNQRPEVEDAGRDEPRRELLGVVPADVVEPLPYPSDRLVRGGWFEGGRLAHAPQTSESRRV